LPFKASLGFYQNMAAIALRISVAIGFVFAILDPAGAQTPSTPSAPPENGAGSNVAGPVSLLSNYEFWLTVSVLLFGVFSIVFSQWSASRVKRAEPEHIVRLLAVNLIVIGTLVTITAGLSDKQIAPAFGLFGTIAGYLLGRGERGRTEEKQEPTP
jgi:hypothetical protein